MYIPRLFYRLLLPLLALCVCSSTVANAGSTPAKPTEAMELRNQFIKLLEARNFVELDRRIDQARRDHLTIALGYPKLQIYYNIFSQGCGCTPQETDAMDWITWRKNLNDWRAQYPRSVSAQILDATYDISYGQYVRGSGWARSVTPEQWKELGANIEKAYQKLQQMSGPARQDPGWYIAMLKLTRYREGDHKDEYLDVLKEAMTKFPYYLPVYTTGSYIFEPKWGGSNEALSTFIDQSARRTYPRWGDSLYARLYSSELIEGPQDELAAMVDWPRMRAGFERLIHDYPAKDNYAAYARFSCQYGDIDALKQAMPHVDATHFDSVWWGQTPQFFQYCLQLSRRDLPGQKPDEAPNARNSVIWRHQQPTGMPVPPQPAH
ncbi:DUF4034 domain-containing protein [Amantichitinum ursilacus]|uniref:DUF4034 domain-containing protein n=1 Tax=Amantichitinum ursilacus TaxID=857265 RepID=A0A0N0XGL0_9NEIS|nr:DUF4034 domain-containing protein [Amantichitinum ursilacus]KPC50179.1 hypothetical protein WG78_18280 [Amantichitinum ursilacus]